MRTLVYLALGAVLTACPPDFEKQSEILRVRVLAIQATPAELALDPRGLVLPQPVTFRALAVAPEGRPVTVRYGLCRGANPYAAEVECPGRDALALPDGTLDVLDPAVQQVLLESLNAAAGGPPGGGPPGGGAPDFNDPALRQALARGIPVFVGYEASDGTGSAEGVERGVRRLTMRMTETPNQNPTLVGLLHGEEPLGATLPPDTEVVLRPQLAEGSAERFMGADGEQTEQLFHSWYATEGEVAQLRSLEPVDGRAGDPTTSYRTPAAPRRVTLYVVTRDGRGGVDWLERTVEMTP